MRQLIYIIAITLVILLLTGCKTKTVYVPVEKARTEIEIYDRWNKDSIYIHDSIFLAHRNDTVFLEKYKYIYRDKLVKDSVHLVDSIVIDKPYPVIEVREINHLRNWQVLLMCLGAACIGWAAFRLIKFFCRHCFCVMLFQN